MEGFRSYQKTVEHLKEEGLYRFLRPVETGDASSPGRVRIGNRSVLLLASNNYLGLADHPLIREAAINAIRRYGFGSGASRLISGNNPLHTKLEDRIAQLKGTESALVYNTGYMANLGLISALVPDRGFLLADRLCHASLIEGCRLSRARFRIFAHGNLDQLENRLKNKPKNVRTVVITEGVFSMDGDVAPLPRLLELALRYQATLLVDDAHGTGVMGKNGRGTLDHFGLPPQSAVQTGTLGKALGSFGAYVTGPRALIEYLINVSKPFIYTTALPPAVSAAAVAALDVLRAEPDRIERLWQNRNYFADGLRKMGFSTMGSETPIIPLLIGDSRQALLFSERLLKSGIYAPAIRPPTVPRETSRIRFSLMATHARSDLEFALETIEKTARGMGIL